MAKSIQEDCSLMCNWHLFILGLVKEHRVGLNGFQKFIEGHGGDLKLIMEQIWPCSLPDIKDMFKMSRCMLKTSSGSGKRCGRTPYEMLSFQQYWWSICTLVASCRYRQCLRPSVVRAIHCPSLYNRLTFYPSYSQSRMARTSCTSCRGLLARSHFHG